MDNPDVTRQTGDSQHLSCFTPIVVAFSRPEQCRTQCYKYIELGTRCIQKCIFTENQSKKFGNKIGESIETWAHVEKI